MLFLTAIVLLPLTLAAASGLEERGADSCTDVHLFLARGAGEAYPGRVGGLADAVCGSLSSCSYENILFTSTASSLYCNSAAEGAANGVAQITAYHSLCPKSKLVLGGYSLGAQVVGDLLGGGGGGFFNCIEPSSGPLDPTSSPGKNIAAVILFGDTRHVEDQPYNAGSGSGANGQYPRAGAQLAGLNAFSSKIQSYCLSTDPVCALGDDGESHTTYIQVDGAIAGSWVVSMINNPQAVVSSSSIVVPTTSSTSVPTTSSVISTTSSSLTPFVFSSTSSVSIPTASSITPISTTSISISTTSSVTPVSTTSPTSILTPFIFSSTSMAPITASSISALSTASSSLYTGTTTSAVLSAQPTSSVPSPVSVAPSATPTNASGGGARVTKYSLSLGGLAVLGALIF